MYNILHKMYKVNSEHMHEKGWMVARWGEEGRGRRVFFCAQLCALFFILNFNSKKIGEVM